MCGTKTACSNDESLHGMMVRDIISATDEVEDGGEIRTESRGLASPAPACFLKHLFVQSEAESRKFQGFCI